MRGRPPEWNPFAGLDETVWLEAAEIDSRLRLTIPVTIRRRLDWLDGQDWLLAEVESEGGTRLSPWEPDGRERIAAIERRLAHLPAARRGDLLVAAMDRYLRLSCERGMRLALPGNLRRHLDPGGEGRVWLVVRDGRLWLWGDAQWAARRPARLQAIEAAD